MGAVKQLEYWRVRPGGGRERVKTRDWYAVWQVAGKTRRKRIGTKAAAVSALAKFEDAEVRRRHGLSDPAAEAAGRARALAAFLPEYVALLAARDTSPEHRANVDAQLTRLLAGCKWHTFADIDPDSLLAYLGTLRDRPRAPAIRGAARVTGGPGVSDKVPARGLGPATLNGYIRTAKAFARWVSGRLGARPPLAAVTAYPEEVDRRRTKQILTDEQLSQLLAATAAAGHKSNCPVRGADRAMLYRLAAFTGLRAGDLAELRPEHFALDATPPTVTIPARDTKGKREEPVPLPAHLVAALKPWLAGKTGRLFPGTWARHKHETKWLTWDLKRAGVDAPGAHFHGLKRRYVVRLIEQGAKVHQVRRLARHKDARTTLAHYTDENMAELGALADRLPPV